MSVIGARLVGLSVGVRTLRVVLAPVLLVVSACGSSVPLITGELEPELKGSSLVVSGSVDGELAKQRDGDWEPSRWGECVITLEAPGLGPASIGIDPARRPPSVSGSQQVPAAPLPIAGIDG